MTRTINLIAVFGPFVALAVAIPLLWGDLLGPSDVVAFVVLLAMLAVRPNGLLGARA
jgi:branched-subunit amino acid ABC-type transport system permease component